MPPALDAPAHAAAQASAAPPPQLPAVRRWMPTKTTEHQAFWSARAAEAAEAGGVCLVCLQFHGYLAGLCSVCCQAVVSLRQPWDAITAEFSPEALLEVIRSNDSERRRVAAIGCASVCASLDGISARLSMPLQLFQHFKRHLRTCEVSPRLLARQLLDFGRPLMTSKQAAELLEFLRGRGEADYKYYHVLCSRVVDSWNMTEATHGIGACYYGFFENFAPPIRQRRLAALIGETDLETLAGVYWAMLHNRVEFARGIPQWVLATGFAHENFWDQDLLNFIRGDMHEHAVDTPFDVVMTCEHRPGGVVSCTNPAGELIGNFPVPKGQDPFGHWIRDAVDIAMSDHCIHGATATAGGLGGRVCLVKPTGEIIWRGTAPSAFEKVCWRLSEFS